MQEPIPVLQQTVDTATWQSLRHFPNIMVFNDVTSNPDQITDPSRGEELFTGFRFRYSEFLNQHDEFCELWIAKCPLVRNNDIL